MPRTRSRSPSPAIQDAPKRRKTSHSHSPSPVDPASRFAHDVFQPDYIARLHNIYKANKPFKHAIVDRLFQDDLLEKVKDECLGQLSFTTKETDIYKINQTGDLASLNYLSPQQLSLLSNLQALRDALYSREFRQFLQSVTGCGALSGVKQDMSVASYTKSCHLLNHDDVIGTRRVSYILYMPLPHRRPWQKDWGGALELYPVRINEEGQSEPEPIPSKSILPSWNQFILFEVQPGKSFHSVQEVVVGGADDSRDRLSISGWFHAAQEGEEGYEPLPAPDMKSSREQLASTSTTFTPYEESAQDIMLPDDYALSECHIDFLSEYLNPVYLQPRTMKALATRFIEESSIELHSFLSNDLANALEDGLHKLDTKHGLDGRREIPIPPHTAGADGTWAIKAPPHKWRYCVLKEHEPGAPAATVRPLAKSLTENILRNLQDELFTSSPFRTWITLVSRLIPLKHHAEARRFRPGLDYTLATSEEKEPRLDVVLGLTPENKDDDRETGRGRPGRRREERGWLTGEWGGWECYMAPHDEDDDPAIYRSGASKQSHENGNTNLRTKTGSSDSSRSLSQTGTPLTSPTRSTPPTPVTEDEDESTLLTVQPGFNRLLLVLRDERVMRFVKYVSADADGSRWDICGEYEVGMAEDEEMGR